MPDPSPSVPPVPAGTVPTRSSAHPARWALPAGLALALLALLGGLALGRGNDARVSDAASLGFLRDMTVHHTQAVQMSEVAHRRAADPALVYTAFDILSTQQGQIGIMTGWLDLWRQPQGSPGAPMAWMGHSGPMPGLAAQDDVDALDALPVARMEEQYLRLMIRHHRGAVPMAEAAARQAGSPDVARLAQQMAVAQQSEIDAMQDALRARGLPAEPDAAPAGGHGDGRHGAPTASARPPA